MEQNNNTQTLVQNRYDFILLFDVTDGNPNGDPDSGNLPRLDPETSEGLVTDVCIKRKVRNYVQIASNNDIFVKENAILNHEIDRAVLDATKEDKKTKNKQDRDKARALMCKRFYDVRAFGGVLSTGNNAGQVRGPIQLTFGRSIDPIFPHEHTITRMAATDEKEAKSNEEADDKGGNRTMGRKATVSYGLYRMHGFVTPHFAKDTGFTEDDLALFWEALQNMFDVDHSAARGLMSLRKLIVFKHDSEIGNAPAHKLFELVQISRKENDSVPRKFSDYVVTIDKKNLPEHVEIQEIV